MTALPLPVAILFAAAVLLVVLGIAAKVYEIRSRKPAVRYCVGCGCTDDRACPGGCFWITTSPAVCSRCYD